MKRNMNFIASLSFVLMVCVLIVQGGWFYHVHKIKTDEFRQNVSFLFTQNSESYFQEKFLYICVNLDFKYYLESDMKTLTWGIVGEKQKGELSNPLQQYDEVSHRVTHDFLYKKKLLDLHKLDSIYKKVLQENGILQSPVLLLQDRETKEILMTTDSLYSLEGKIFTSPIDVGYKHKHQLVAAFYQPSILNTMTWHLVLEGVFVICFIFCFIWQYKKITMIYRSAEVQTMGIAHLEHELKKPIATMISVVGGIVARNNRELTETQELKLKLMKSRLLKMADVTDTMLTVVNSSRLEVERVVIDIRKEMELIAEMFSTLSSHAKVDIQIEEGVEKVLLDETYFNYLVINLIDNAIKYCKESPEVKVWFGKEDEYWVLRVTDNGIGISSKNQKQIFQQFYRVQDKHMTKKTGFGLGLTFVKKVAEAYGGDSNVKSQLGQGSSFIIRLK